MRFQGENCTLSFGLSFEGEQVLVNGTIWPRRPDNKPSRHQSSPLRFVKHFSEADFVRLQHWLASDSVEPLPLPSPLRYLRRLTTPTDGVTYLELELAFDQVPPWWNWEITFPLKVKLEIRKNEFNYLTNSLGREHWSTDLTW